MTRRDEAADEACDLLRSIRARLLACVDDADAAYDLIATHGLADDESACPPDDLSDLIGGVERLLDAMGATLATEAR